MADEKIPPEVLQAFVTGIKESFATVLIGFCIGTTLYGITVLQTYLYYKNYSKDNSILKALVSVFWLLDTLTTVLVAHSIYTYFVFNLGDVFADDKIPWSFALENEIVDVITLLAQCYFGYQLLKVSGNKFISSVVFILAWSTFALDVKVTIQIFSNLTLEALGERNIYIYGSIVQGMSALCDMIITFSLVYYLHGSRSGVPSTGVIIDNLILYAVTRGFATTLCQLFFMILNVRFPDHTYWQPFHQAVGKLYVNSVLASLNFRRNIHTGLPAIPLGKQTPSTTVADSFPYLTGNSGTSSDRTAVVFARPCESAEVSQPERYELKQSANGFILPI